jgi:hypothetical protein
MNMKACGALLICLIFIFSCHKNNDSPSVDLKAPLAIQFDNVVGNDDLRLNTGNYINSSGENFSVTFIQYFISNIILKKTDGTEVIVKQDSSYFLINENNNTTRPVIQVPEGEYNTLIFTLGIDSSRSAADLSQRGGVLLPSSGIYFNENEGYIFLSMQGNSPQAAQNPFKFNIGGYGGKTSPTFNNLKTVTIDLTAGGTAKVHTGKTAEIRLKADILKIFSGAADVSLAEHPIIMFEPYSTNIADNYANMFHHDTTIN